MNAVRFLFWIPVLLAVILGVVATTPGPARAGESIVPPASRITEHEARLELARLLGENPNHWLEARIQFERILAEDPGDLDAGLGLARLLARQGHARQSRGLVLGLLDNHPDDLSLRLALANVVLTWGDFGLSEDILRDLLTRPNLGPAQQREVLLELARVFVAAQRYEEAGGILDGLLLDDQGDREALTALVGLRLEEKNFPAALALLDHSALLVDGTSLDPNLLRLRSRALAGTGDYRAALGALDARCLSTPDDDLNRAELWLKMNEPDRAQEILTHVVARHPDQIRARLLLADLDPDATKVHTPDFVAQLCQNATSPARLTLWGDEYARVLAFEPARACYQAALDLDPEFFPASLGLIQTEASARRYNASLALLDDLLTELPHTAKLLLLQARVLSWAGRYDESLAAYQALHERWPHDPVPIMESARVAFWAKEPDTAQTLYQTAQVSEPARTLAPEARMLADMTSEPAIRQALIELAQSLDQGRVYPAFAALEAAVADHPPSLSTPVARRMDRFLIDLRPTSRIQQAASQEERAKTLAWNRRFLPALAAYDELLATRPDNQEAFFDLAQIQCALGLSDLEERTCRRLLDLDPLHGRANQALERLEIRSSVGLRAGYGFWNEQSHGGSRLSAMERHHQQLAVDLPFAFGRYHLFAAQHFWLERPKSIPDARDDFSGSYAANGLSLGLGGVITPWLRGSASLTRKEYEKSSLGHRHLGQAGLEINVEDWVRLGLEYERREELANGLALRQEIMADVWRLKASSALTRRLDLALTGEFKDMSDDNHGLALRGDLGFVLTDHPRELKITLTGESRDFRHTSQYEYDGPELVDVVHPYWTPRNYTAGAVTLQWRHDLAEFLFCGAEKNVYQLSLSGGTDSEDNPAVRLEGSYHLDFARRWGLVLQGLVHSSPQWDAQGLWASLEYRF